jgi:hypothetical protein
VGYCWVHVQVPCCCWGQVPTSSLGSSKTLSPADVAITDTLIMAHLAICCLPLFVQ